MLLVILTLIVAILYLGFRPYYWVSVLLAGYLFFMVRKALGQKTKTLQLYPWQIFWWLILGFFILANLYNLWWQNFHQISFLTTQLYLGQALLQIIPGLGLIFLAALGAGQKIFSWLGLTARVSLERATVSLTLGLALLSYLAFGLAYLDLFKLRLVLPILLVLVALSLKQIAPMVSLFFGRPISLKLDGKNYLFWIPLSLTLLLLVALTFYLAGFPIEYDSNFLYLNTAQLIANSGRLWSYSSTPILPYNLELINAYGLLIGRLPLGTLLNSLIGFLALGMVWVMARRFFGQLCAHLSVAALLAAPMTSYLLTLESKTDQGLLLFGSLALYFFLRFVQGQEGVKGTEEVGEEGLKYLALTGFFLGFSMGVKYTAVFLIIAVVTTVNLWLMTEMIRKRRKIRAIILANVILALFGFLAFSPWMWRHLTAADPSRYYIRVTHAIFPGARIQLRHLKIELDIPVRIINKIQQIDLARYVRGYSLKDRLWHLWDALAGQSPHHRHTRSSLGPIYFILLFALVYLVLSRRLKLTPKTRILGMIVIFYFAAWYYRIFEVTWYAYPGWAFWGILGVAVLTQATIPNIHKLWLTRVFVFLALVQTLYTANLHLSLFLLPELGPKRLQASPSARTETHAQIVNVWQASQMFNQPELVDQQAKIFYTSYPFWRLPMLYVRDNDQRIIYNNEYLFNQNLSDEEILALLREHEIEYVARTVTGGQEWWFETITLDNGDPVGRVHFEREEAFLQKYGQLIKKTDLVELYRLSDGRQLPEFEHL